MDTIRCLSMHQRNAYAFQEAERDKALFLIPKPIVLEGECWASKDFLRISKVKAVILEVRSSLGFTPRKSHIESVYTYRIFVKEVVGSGLTSSITCRRPNGSSHIHSDPHAGGGQCGTA
jgi:hypothetical protein